MLSVVRFFGLLSLSCAAVHSGESLGISPAIALIEHVQPGAEINLGAKGLIYRVHNQGGPEQAFVFDVATPPTYSLKAFEAGYEPLPDASWLTLEHTNVIAPANGHAGSGVTLRIPDGPEHYNRHYVVYIEAGVGQQVALGATLKVRARLLIETATSADDAAPATSAIAVCPGRVDMTRADNKNWQGAASVRNQGPDATFDVLALSAVYPDNIADRRGRFFPGNVKAIKDESQLQVDKDSFVLKNGEKITLTFVSPATITPEEQAIDAVRFVGRRAPEGATDVRMIGGQAYDRIELIRIRHTRTNEEAK